jgi:cytochrome c oxidase subunit IV
MLDRILSRRTYLLIDAALILLALTSIGAAHLDLRGFNALVALAIAALKASLIALFFMELKFASPLPRLVALAALFWLGLMLVGTLDDLLTRVWLPVPGK